MHDESNVNGVRHFIGSDGLENEGNGFKKRGSGALHGVRSAFEIACVWRFKTTRKATLPFHGLLLDIS
jgi:hypothetical protein